MRGGGRGVDLHYEYGERGENLKLQENTEKGTDKVNSALLVVSLIITDLTTKIYYI